MATIVPADNKSVIVDSSSGDDGGRRGGYGGGQNDNQYHTAERVKDAVGGSLEQVLASIAGSVVAINKCSTDNLIATEKTGAAAVLATETSASALNLSVEKTAAAGQATTERTASAVAVAMAANFANTQNMLITGFKDGRYDAATNMAALQAAMAECCCEIKALVASDGGKTRDLVNAIDGRRSDRELVDAKNEVTLLKLQLAAHPSTTPVIV